MTRKAGESPQVGMQNSALGAVLATQHFASPLTAIPCAISASCHSCIGSLLAGAWRLQDSSGGGGVGTGRTQWTLYRSGFEGF